MIYGVILAGGVGSRMGGDKPKQYLTVKNKPIIIYTIEKFYAVPDFEKIIVLCPKQWVEHTKNLIEKYIPQSSAKVSVIEGGDTRNETIMNSIKFIENEGNLDDETVIVTHDSVRPFVTHRIIRKILLLQKSSAPAILLFLQLIQLLSHRTIQQSVPSRTEAKCIRVRRRSPSMPSSFAICIFP